MLNPSRKESLRVMHMRGVTLIELLVVVVIIGILASIAYPSYRAQVMKTHRADGQATLMQVSQQLERCYTRFSRYNDPNCAVAFPVASPDGYYSVTAPTLTASAFTLDAAPQDGQTEDGKCGALMLTSTGVQGSLGSSINDTNGCWR